MNPYNVGTVREGKDLIEKALSPLGVASRKLSGNFRGLDMKIYELHERLYADLQDLRKIREELQIEIDEYDKAIGVKKEFTNYTFEEKAGDDEPRRTKIGDDPILDLQRWEFEIKQLHPLSQEEREKIIHQIADWKGEEE